MVRAPALCLGVCSCQNVDLVDFVGTVTVRDRDSTEQSRVTPHLLPSVPVDGGHVRRARSCILVCVFTSYRCDDFADGDCMTYVDICNRFGRFVPPGPVPHLIIDSTRDAAFSNPQICLVHKMFFKLVLKSV